MGNIESPDQLTDREVYLLVKLLFRMAAVDGRVSDGERAVIRGIANLVGARRFSAAAQAASENSTSEEVLLANLGAVRPSARHLFISMLSDVSRLDGVEDEEDAFFRKVVDTWRRSASSPQT